MADEILSFEGVDVTGIVAGTADFFTWAFLLIAIAGGLYLVWYLMSFRNKLVIRDLANNRKIVKTGNWKEYKDKNGISWLITPFKKIKKPLPPANAIDLTPKGRKFVEAYRGEDSDTLLWITDEFDYEAFKKTTTESFQPLVTQERELLANEIVKGYSYEKKTTWEQIIQILPWLVPVIMVIVIAVTLGDITEALTKYSGSVQGPMKEIADGLNNAADKLGSVQTSGLNSDASINTLEAPN